MNIEQMKAAVEAIVNRQIDPTIWDRFARSCHWHSDVAELLAGLFLDAEPDIILKLAELDAAEQGVEQ